MNKHLITAIIFLMTFSLLGLIGFQIFWIKHALQLKEEQFDRRVSDALQKVVEKLETQEAVDVITEQIKTIHLTQENEQPAVIKPSRLRVLTPPPQKKVQKATPAPTSENVPTLVKVRTRSRNFPGLQDLDTATLRHLTRINSFVDTIRLHENLNKRFIWVKTDTGNRTIIYPDTLGSQTHSVFLRPATTGEFSSSLVKLDSVARFKPIKVSPDRVEIISRVFQEEKVKSGNTDRIYRLQKNPEDRVFRISALPRSSVNRKQVAVVSGSPKRMVPGSPALLPPASAIFTQSATDKASPAAIKKTEKQKKVKAKTNQLTEVVQKMAVEYVRKSLPLEKRLPKAHLDTMVKKELEQADIKLPFEYAIKQGQANGHSIQTVNYKPIVSESQYQIRLFPNDIYTEPNFLTLQFPDRDAYLLHSFRYLMGFSGLFTGIMLITFWVTIHTILKQKKISEIKNDFINNMTHEFKTPLATISLAVDAIANPKILENKDRIKKYAGIIRDENKRMHKQVEDVLQMALLDKQELKLNLQLLSLHPLIHQTIQNMQLLLESKGGTIKINLEAPNPMILGDEAHLGNVIGNLLDNAIKYSPAAPEITLSTVLHQGYVALTISDQGMGMSRDTQLRIFDKFYRVSTGNLHPVKGFGLGLAYVKAIVLAHKGQISVKSELGRGSSFTLFLPYITTS